MNRGVLQSSPVQQMMAANNWWNINNMRPPPPPQPPQPSPFLNSPSNLFPHHHILPPPPPSPPTTISSSSSSWHDHQDHLPESWSQLLLGGLVGEEDRCGLGKKMENWEDQMLLNQAENSACGVDVKPENSSNTYVYGGGHGNVEYQAAQHPMWSQMMPVSSPKSCVTTASLSSSSNMLDFSSSKTDKRHHPPPDLSPECNSTAAGGAFKKARVQPPPSTSSTFKVRKEKLGDRITSLHQLVSPFGKTDTASVLLEAIGYIRFLQSQIEALSLPYLGSGSGNNMRQQQHSVQGERNCLFPEDPGQLLNDSCMKRKGACEQGGDEEEAMKKDLRSRGLCLVPISCTLQVGSDNGADYWAPAGIGGGFGR